MVDVMLPLESRLRLGRRTVVLPLELLLGVVERAAVLPLEHLLAGRIVVLCSVGRCKPSVETLL